MATPKFTRLLAAELAALIAILLHALLSHDWCCGSLGAGLLAGVAAYVLDWLFEALVEPKHPMPTRATIMIITGLLGGLLFHLTPNEAFQMAFRTPAPQGITGLTYRLHYAGGPGDAAMWMQFSADHSTVEKLIAQGGFTEDPDQLQMCLDTLPDRDFKACIFGGINSKERDEAVIVPSFNLRQFEYGTNIEHVVVLWDTGTNEVWVLYTYG
ncbi:MAG: hypothetical protein J5J06_06605 [Phycisphaerae bacterium]|nr:hypothetical protein [Phycisphaerae bacterium]